MSAGEQQQRRTNETDQIKAEVRHTIRRLSEMTRTEESFDQFCQTVLAQVVKLTGAHGALLWQVNGNGMPTITHAAGEKSRVVAENATPHLNLVKEVVDQGKPLGLPYESVAGNGEPNPNGESNDDPNTKFLMLFSPVYNRMKKCCGSIELLQRNDITSSAQEGYLRFLTQIAQLFPRWHEQQDLAKLTDGAEMWNKKVDYMTEVHRSIDTKETTFTIANEARRMLGCDRVSVAQWYGGKCKISAISSQDRFDNRANVVRKLASVATASVKADSKFWVLGETEGLAPEVAKKINLYLDESHSRTLAVIPLMQRPSDVPDLEMNKRLKKKARKLGALVIEYFDADVPEAQIQDACGLIVTHAELALENARRHNEIFLMPVWQKIGWMQNLLFRDHLTKTLLGLACLTLFVLALFFVPKELKMSADGVMNPTERELVYAGTQGKIVEVLPTMSADGKVKKGDLLIRIENDQLTRSILSAQGELTSTKEKIRILQANLNNPESTQAEQIIAEGELNVLDLKLKNLNSQLELMNTMQNKQEIRSNMDGSILTWQPIDRLEKFFVSADTEVLRVANLNGDWDIELKITQKKVGYVGSAMEKSDEELLVEFQMATNPSVRFEGRLKKIESRAVMSETGEPEYRAIVRIDKEQIEKLRESENRGELKPSVGVTAKIHCGKRKLGFVWFYQVYDYVLYELF